jgi:hypothetical protein
VITAWYNNFCCFGILALLGVGCQAPSSKSFGGNIIVKFVSAYQRGSTFSQPEDSEAVLSTPIAINATFVDVLLTPAEATNETESYQLNTESPSAIRIVDRPQIVYTKKLTAFADGLSFASASVQLDPAVTLIGKDQNYDVTMGDEYFTSSGAFTKESGKDITLTVTFKWRDLILTDAAGGKTASLPEISVEAASK